MQLTGILIVLAAVACLVGYQIKYVYDSHRRPASTPFGFGGERALAIPCSWARSSVDRRSSALGHPWAIA